VVFRCENVQIVSQLIDGKFPDYQAILPKDHKTRAVLDAGDLLKACKQASIIAREGSNVVRFHLQPGADQTGRVKLLAESDETGASEIELDATVEGQELEIAFNVKFLQDGLEAITTKNVTIEANAHNTPAVLHSTGDEENLYVLMPMHIDGR
jgi:DNA polymerase-3 subunit beta